MTTGSTTTSADRGQLALETLDAARELVALGAEGIELLLPRHRSLLVLGQRRLQSGFPSIDVLHLGFEARHSLLRRQPPGKERVGEKSGQQNGGDDDEPGGPSARLGDHGP